MSRPRGLGLPAHVTVLFPFRPVSGLGRSTARTLRDVASESRPFTFRLVRIGRFPDVVYLAPEPDEPFAPSAT